MRKLLLLTFCVSLLLCGCGIAQAGEITVKWTAPGDDDTVGIASAYNFKWSNNSAELTSNFDMCNNCSVVPNPPTPDTAGTCQSFLIGNLPVGQPFYLAVKTVDDAGNWSDVSNVLPVLIPDTDAPAAVTDLQIGNCQ